MSDVPRLKHTVVRPRSVADVNTPCEKVAIPCAFNFQQISVMAKVPPEVGAVLRRLLDDKDHKPGSPVRISQQSLATVCRLSKGVILADPLLVELGPPLHVIGDIQGEYDDLLRIFGKVGRPPDRKFLFLGDYVDGGTQGVETMALLLAYEVLHPSHVFLLRGSHEIADVNALHGFKTECVTRYSPRVWTMFNEVFDILPVAASIGHKIFACHAGMSPEITDLQFFETIQRPLANVTGPIADLLWSDPDPDGGGWTTNKRGKVFCYGPADAHKFLDTLKFEILLKSHQMVNGGFEFPFEPDRCVVTIFSAPRGGAQDNNGAVMVINEDFECSFVSIKPKGCRAPGSRPAFTPLDEILSMKASMSKTLPNRPW
jgi:serine/threonine-protein phosphatase PP1 catalytic subunit